MSEINEILDRVEPRFGSRSRAYEWYRSEALPGFNGQTAKQLVQAGKVAAVMAYIEAVDAGVHA